VIRRHVFDLVVLLVWVAFCAVFAMIATAPPAALLVPS